MTGLAPAPTADLWVRCAACGEVLYARRYRRSARTCQSCGTAGMLPAVERIALLADADSAVELPVPDLADDPLRFTDTAPYAERLRRARAGTGLQDACVAVTAEIEGLQVVLVAMDFRFMGGSLGRLVGEQVTRAIELATERRVPIVIVTASGGARMQEGGLALMQMVKTSQALGEADAAGVLTISLLTDPTYGGVAASFATLTDVILAEKGARTGFAGPRVVAQTTRASLPPDFQTAASLYATGMVDAVLDRPALRGRIATLVRNWWAARRPVDVAARVGAAWAVSDPDEVADAGAWASVQLARHEDRPAPQDYCDGLLSDAVELHGDRLGADCPALFGATGSLAGRRVLVLGTRKGRDTTERVQHNFGMVTPGGYRKVARLLRLAEKWALPVVTFVDTPGADPGVVAERHGQAWAIADTLRLMAGLAVPIVAVVTGEGGSGGALALSVADRVIALSNSVYSVISPEGCASILWRDAGAAETAAEALRLHAPELLRSRIVDAVVPEPGAGAHTDHSTTIDRVGAVVADALDELACLDDAERRKLRHDRFRSF